MHLINRSTRKLASAEAGRLRINAPMAFGTLDLALGLLRFLHRYPERHVELIEDGFDVVLRLARDMPDSTQVASPRYLQRHGIPVIPTDPTRHHCLAAVYPQSHPVPAKVRAFVELAADVYRQPAWH